MRALGFPSRILLAAALLSIILPLSAQERAEPLWRYPTGGRLIGHPAWVPRGEGGVLYALAEDRHLYAFTAAGKLLWKFYLTHLPTGPLGVGRDESIYVALSPGSLGAINPRGSFIWKTSLGAGKVEGLALSERGLIFAATEEGWLFCLDHRGRIRWGRRMSAPPSASPVYASKWGVLYSASDQRMTAYSPGGRRLWTALLAAPGHSLLPLSFGIAGATTGGTLSLFDYQGKRLWSRSFAGSSKTSLLGGKDGLILEVEGEGVIHFSPDGSRREEFSLKEGGLFAVGANTSLVLDFKKGGIELSGLQESLAYRLETSCTGAVIADNEILFTGGEDWNIRAYRIPFIPEGPWSQPGGDGRRAYRGSGPPGPGGELSIAELSYLTYLADSAEEGLKLQALEEIETGLREKKYTGTEPSLLALVERLAGEGRANPSYEGKTVINDFPRVRWKAAALLGEWGDLASRDTLLQAFAYEWEPLAAVAQARALGRMGSDPYGKATRLLASRVNSLSSQEERFLWGVNALKTLEDFILYNGDYPDPAGIKMIYTLYRGDYGREARKKALELLEP